jgi:hypothetical protein
MTRPCPLEEAVVFNGGRVFSTVDDRIDLATSDGDASPRVAGLLGYDKRTAGGDVHVLDVKRW